PRLPLAREASATCRATLAHLPPVHPVSTESEKPIPTKSEKSASLSIPKSNNRRRFPHRRPRPADLATAANPGAAPDPPSPGHFATAATPGAASYLPSPGDPATAATPGVAPDPPSPGDPATATTTGASSTRRRPATPRRANLVTFLNMSTAESEEDNHRGGSSTAESDFTQFL
ncbi:hypothetical protein U9M48_001791, partial [Paspalum notatum var. saurae]